MILPQDCEKYIEKLLSLYVRFTVLVEEAFKKDYRFRMARDQVRIIFLFLTFLVSCNEAFACYLCYIAVQQFSVGLAF